MTRDTVVIWLGEDPAELGIEWLRPDGATGEAMSERGTLDDAALACGGRRVVALVPATAVLLVAAEIPARNQQRILQALPYVLEEQLTTDVERLHFALGQRDGQGVIRAAVVERDQMEGWTEALRSAGIEVELMLPEVLALPLQEGAWTLCIHGETALVRTGYQSGFAADTVNLPVLLPRAIDEAGEERPQRILIYGDQRWPDEEMLASLPVERRGLDGDMLQFLGRHLDENSAINLLQGGYSRREQLGRLWRPWLPSAALLGALLLVNAAMLVTDFFRLSSASVELAQEIEQIYRQTFPGASRIVNPRVQMERRLQSLRAGGSSDTRGFLELVSQTAPLLKQSGGLTLQRINYHDGDLSLALVIGDLQSLDELKQRLTDSAGLAVEIQSATARNDGVEARLQLTRRAP